MVRALPHVMATFLVVLLVVELASTASASYLTVYKGPGCKQPAETYSNCGCHNIKYYGGYKFFYKGKPAHFYKQAGCKGQAKPYMKNEEYCKKFDAWKSVKINC